MNKIKALFAALLTTIALLGAGAIVAASPAAAATQSTSINCWGYTYYGTVNYTRSGGTITVNSYSISGSSPLEWRARWFAVAGNVIEDSGYHDSDASPINRSPGWSRYMGAGSKVLLNAGKTGDGHATCEMWFTLP